MLHPRNNIDRGRSVGDPSHGSSCWAFQGTCESLSLFYRGVLVLSSKPQTKQMVGVAEVDTYGYACCKKKYVVVTTHKLMASTSNNINHIAAVAVVRRFESVIERFSTLKTGSLMTSSLSSVSTVLTNTSRSFSCSACPSGKSTTLG